MDGMTGTGGAAVAVVRAKIARTAGTAGAIGIGETVTRMIGVGDGDGVSMIGTTGTGVVTAEVVAVVVGVAEAVGMTGMMTFLIRSPSATASLTATAMMTMTVISVILIIPRIHGILHTPEFQVFQAIHASLVYHVSLDILILATLAILVIPVILVFLGSVMDVVSMEHASTVNAYVKLDGQAATAILQSVKAAVRTIVSV